MINRMNGVKVVLGLGSNCGDRRNAVEAAMEWLSEILEDCCVSDIYETLPVGHPGNSYMNAVVSGIFEGDLSCLETMCKEYEVSHGRDKESRMLGMVPVDIDIVIAGSEILRTRDYRCSFFKIGYSQIMRKSATSLA